MAHCVTSKWRNISHYCRPLRQYDVWFPCPDNREALTAAPTAHSVLKQAFRVHHWTSSEASLRHSSGWRTEAFPLSSVICAPVIYTVKIGIATCAFGECKILMQSGLYSRFLYSYCILCDFLMKILRSSSIFRSNWPGNGMCVVGSIISDWCLPCQQWCKYGAPVRVVRNIQRLTTVTALVCGIRFVLFVCLFPSSTSPFVL